MRHSKSLPLAAALCALTASLSAQEIYGTACVDGSGATPGIAYPASSWALNPSVNEVVALTGSTAGLSSVLFIGDAAIHRTNIDLGVIGATGCSLLVSPFAQVPRTVTGAGTAEVALGPVPFGHEFVFQWVQLDPAAPRNLGVVTSNGLQAGVPQQTSAFRVSRLQLLDPHVFTLLFGFLCADGTNTLLNPLLDSAINGDSEPDGLLDISLLMLFRPLDPNAAGGHIDIVLPSCTAPAASTVCSIGTSLTAGRVDYVNGASNCLPPVPNTTGGYSPGVTSPTGPCFSTTAGTLTLPLGLVNLPLDSVRIGGKYVGSPVNRITEGVVYGFLPESVANTLMLPPGLPVSGTIASLFPGGTGNCSARNDLDVGPDGTTPGWWVYLGFEADAVPITH